MKRTLFTILAVLMLFVLPVSVMAAGSWTQNIYDTDRGLKVLTLVGTADSAAATFPAMYTQEIHGYVRSIETVPGTRVNLNDHVPTYKWLASAGGTNEYYCVLYAGTNPSLADPTYVIINGTSATEETAGALSAGTWDYGDNDTLGYNTVYVRLSDGADPDAKPNFNIISVVNPPTDNYDIEILDSNGKDIANGDLVNRDILNVEVDEPDYPVVSGPLTINVENNSVNSAVIKIILYYYGK